MKPQCTDWTASVWMAAGCAAALGSLGCGPGPAAQVAAATSTTAPLTAAPAKPRPPKGFGAGARADGSLSCVEQAQPGDDAPSPWSVELERRLTEKLAGLAHCTSALTALTTEAESLTARFVYDAEGAPVSQHVIAATPNSCVAADCLLTALGKVTAPTKQNVTRASHDFQLTLAGNAAPTWTAKLIDPLMNEENAASCVDPQVLQLSKEKVHATLTTTFPELKKCHNHAMARNHSAAGLVTFEFVIGHDGSVVHAEVRDSTLYDCLALECMLEQIRPLHFARPVGRAVPVVYPIEFTIEQPPVQMR